ncbi:MAG: CBS domain-containing protein [Thermoanaerobacterales bacterium]|nr:CBS domain-containing protein [Bacillota bacterium]MDI6906687.1 CBS domain-containing protein [Thermoanaerobacterales bacterium]
MYGLTSEKLVRDLQVPIEECLNIGKVVSLAAAARRSRIGRPSKARERVANVMQPIRLSTIEGSATLAEAVHVMVRNAVTILPVFEYGRLTGIIHAGRVLEEAARIMGEVEDQAVSGR